MKVPSTHLQNGSVCLENTAGNAAALASIFRQPPGCGPRARGGTELPTSSTRRLWGGPKALHLWQPSGQGLDILAPLFFQGSQTSLLGQDGAEVQWTLPPSEVPGSLQRPQALCWVADGRL